jgi:O-antigen ligase
LVVAGGLAALAAWTALSALWSPDSHSSLVEAQRTALYFAAIVAAIAVRGRLFAGTLGAIALVCAFAVGQRLLQGPPNPPDEFEGTLLKDPLGYANALAALAAIGISATAVLVLERRRRLPALGLLALLVTTLALTGSRGGWLAAVVGTVVGLALGMNRQRLAAVAGVVAALGLALVLTLPAGSLADDTARYAGDRSWYWHVAWQETAEAPIVGHGAGTFERAWLEEQPIPVFVLDAHSLYLETLAELGLVGFILLVSLLAPPLIGAFRGASASAAGAYVAFLIHAGVDWDWEMPAVTVAGLFCGAVLLRRSHENEAAPKKRDYG